MGLLQIGRVSVANGSSVVRGIHVASVSAVTGTFLETEDVVWGGGGTGLVVEHDTVLNLLRFYRTAGPAPAVGTVIQNAALTKSATISSFTADTAPRFDLLLAGIVPTQSLFPGYGVQYSLTTGYCEDYFGLSVAYAEPSDDDVEYKIIRDHTPTFGWKLEVPGDTDSPTLRSFIVDDIENTVRPQQQLDMTLDFGWASVAGSAAQYWKDADGTVHLGGAVWHASATVPATIATLPSGYRSARTRRFSVVHSGGNGVLEVTPGGGLIAITGTLSSAFYLDGVQYRAEW